MPGELRSVLAKKEPQRQPPRVLVKEIQDVLVLARFRGGARDARELAVHAVEHLDENREQNPDSQPSCRIECRHQEPQKSGGESYLVGGDRTRCEAADNQVFEKGIEIARRQLLRPPLDIVQKNLPPLFRIVVVPDAVQMERNVSVHGLPIRRQRADLDYIDVSCLEVRCVERSRAEKRRGFGLAADSRIQDHLRSLRGQPREEPLIDQQIGGDDDESIAKMSATATQHLPYCGSRGVLVDDVFANALRWRRQ